MRSGFRLPRRIRLTIEQVARVACPPDAEALGLIGPIACHVEGSLAALPVHLRAAMLAGVATFELAAAAAPSSLGRPFSRLPIERARAWFHSWWASELAPARQLAHGLKALAVFAYYEHPLVKRRLGVAQDEWIAEVSKRRLDAFAAEIRRHEALVLARDPLVPAPHAEVQP